MKENQCCCSDIVVVVHARSEENEQVGEKGSKRMVEVGVESRVLVRQV